MAAVTNPSVPTSAKGIITGLLSQFGLASLADWAWNLYTHAGGGDLGLQLVQSELPDTAEFKTRFPAIAQRIAKGLPAITPADYLNYETTIRQSFSAYGLAFPTNGPQFNDMITNLLNHDVSAQEVVSQRIGTAFSRVAQAPVEVRQAAEKLWGVQGDSGLATLFLDPNQSASQLDQLSQAMDVAGNVSRYGIGITAERATRLATLGADQHLSQLAQLAQMRPLFSANVGEDPNLTAEHQGLSAAFGEDATSQAEITRRLDERKAALGGGGQPSSSTRYTAPGLIGLGTGPEG